IDRRIGKVRITSHGCLDRCGTCNHNCVRDVDKAIQWLDQLWTSGCGHLVLLILLFESCWDRFRLSIASHTVYIDGTLEKLSSKMHHFRAENRTNRRKQTR